MGHFSSNKTCSSCATQRSLQPDIRKFQITKIEESGSHMLIEVTYPNCKNYEGKKVLLMRRKSTIELLNMKVLDPHFSKDGGIVARFEPTPQGWAIGLRVLASL